MKSFSCLVVVSFLSVGLASCGKAPVTDPGQQQLGNGGVIPYDASAPATGNWVLQFSDDENGVHIDYPQDTTFSGFRSWASHLVLLKNDSAYWNSAGIDAIAVMGASGTYFISQDKSDTAYYLSLSFPINNVNVFGYKEPDQNTLLLNDLADVNTVYTYKRKQ